MIISKKVESKINYISKNEVYSLYEMILNKLICEGGNWSSEIIDYLENMGIIVFKNKYINNGINNIIKKIK